KIALMHVLSNEVPDNAQHRVELAHAHRSLAHIFRDTGKSPEARKEYDVAIVLESKLLRENPKSGNMRIALANSLLNSVIVLPRKDAEEVARRLLEAVRLQKEAVSMYPKVRGFRQELALGLSDLAGLHADRGQSVLAEEMAREALKLRLDLHGEDKKERWFERYLARSHR